MTFILVFFASVYGNLWHCGALTMIAVAALWIAWPRKEKDGERSNLKLQSALKALVFVGLTGLFAVQIYWTARTLSMDYAGAYSGSLDAANFLHAVGAVRPRPAVSASIVVPYSRIFARAYSRTGLRARASGDSI
jgi:hypothetical protein